MKLLKRDIIITAVLAFILTGLSVYKVIDMRGKVFVDITQRNAAVINDAIAVYRGDNEGQCPQSLDKLVPDYLPKLPAQFDSNGDKSSSVKTGTYRDFDGSGGWLFVYDEGGRAHCQVFVNKIILD